MIIERGCSMAEPELSCEQMEVQVGRLAMRVEHEIEGAAPLGAIRAAAAVDNRSA